MAHRPELNFQAFSQYPSSKDKTNKKKSNKKPNLMTWENKEMISFWHLGRLFNFFLIWGHISQC